MFGISQRFFSTTRLICGRKVPGKLNNIQEMTRQHIENILRIPIGTLKEKINSATFDDFQLEPKVKEALLSSSIQIHRPSAIQFLAIPQIQAGGNVFCAAETGSGKTFAYLLPLISRLRTEEVDEGVLRLNKRPRALILVPSKELVAQVSKVAKSISHTAKLRIEPILDRKPKEKGHFEGPIDLLVSTPQKFLYCVENGTFETTDLRYLIIDEADSMLEKDFGEIVRKLMDKKTLPNLKQTVMVSATIPKSIQSTLKTMFKGNLKFVVSPNIHRPNKKLKQRFIRLNGHGDNKQKTLAKILFDLPPRDFSTIIFCNRSGTAISLKSWMSGLKEVQEVTNSSIEILSGKQSMEERKQILKRFEEGKVTTLVTTDVASRGLDTKFIDHVIIYDFPRTAVDYLHRVGRTGRFGEKGRVSCLIGKNDEKLAQSIKQQMNIPLVRD